MLITSELNHSPILGINGSAHRYWQEALWKDSFYWGWLSEVLVIPALTKTKYLERKKATTCGCSVGRVARSTRFAGTGNRVKLKRKTPRQWDM